MHELSLCRSIYGIADRARDGRRVASIEVRVGQLRQVVPDTLVYCWGLVTEQGPLAGSVLEIDHVPVVIECRACHAQTAITEVLLLVCGECGSGDITVVTGEEFMVVGMRLAAGDPAAQPVEQKES